MGVNRAVLFATAVAAVGGLLFGFDTAVIAGTTQQLTAFFHLTASTLGVTVSCAIWGTILGCLVATRSTEYFGTRTCLRATAVTYLISALGCAFAPNWVAFLVARFLGGLAIGGCSIFSPMYIAEAAPALWRGRLVACFQLSIVSGILVAYSSNSAVQHLVHGTSLWRLQIGVAAMPAAVFLVALFFIPQSARWLVRRGRSAEAVTVLSSLGFENPAREVALASDTLRNPMASAAVSVLQPSFRKSLLIAFALGLFNQLSGINAILYYLNEIFQQAGFLSISAGQQASFVGLANLIFTLVGMAAIDRVGRKPLLILGAAGMTASLTGVACVFATGHAFWLLLPLMLLFISFFASSQGAVVWVYLSEIFPSVIREQGQSLASLWLWVLTAVVSGFFPTIAAVSRSFPFFLFAGFMAAQIFVVWMFFPETKGQSIS